MGLMWEGKDADCNWIPFFPLTVMSVSYTHLVNNPMKKQAFPLVAYFQQTRWQRETPVFL